MDPLIAGSLIQGGSSLFGGFMSNMFNRSSAEDMANFQREFATHGIRWRVRDAEKAGIHPLYALGAQTHQFQPVSIQDSLGPAFAEAGAAVGRGVAGRAENMLRKLQENSLMVDMSNRVKEGENLDLEKTRRQLEIGEIIRGQSNSVVEPHIARGNPQAWYQRYKVAPGFEILAPNSEGEHPLETIESMSPLHREAWIRYNASVYGPGWESQFRNWYHFGVPPGEHFKGDKR